MGSGDHTNNLQPYVAGTFCLSYSIQVEEKAQTLVGGQFVFSWWLLAWFRMRIVLYMITFIYYFDNQYLKRGWKPMVACPFRTEVVLYRILGEITENEWLIHCKYIISMYLQVHTSKSCFCPGTFLRIPGLVCCYGTPLYSVYVPKSDILQGRFRLCDWLSLRCLGPQINPLPSVFRSIFVKVVLNSWLVISVDWRILFL